MVSKVNELVLEKINESFEKPADIVIRVEKVRGKDVKIYIGIQAGGMDMIEFGTIGVREGDSVTIKSEHIKLNLHDFLRIE